MNPILLPKKKRNFSWNSWKYHEARINNFWECFNYKPMECISSHSDSISLLQKLQFHHHSNRNWSPRQFDRIRIFSIGCSTFIYNSNRNWFAYSTWNFGICDISNNSHRNRHAHSINRFDHYQLKYFVNYYKSFNKCKYQFVQLDNIQQFA